MRARARHFRPDCMRAPVWSAFKASTCVAVSGAKLILVLRRMSEWFENATRMVRGQFSLPVTARPAASSIVKQPSVIARFGWGAGCPFVFFRSRKKVRRAERRQALVRKPPHPMIRPRDRTHLRKPPEMTGRCRRPARLSALRCGFSTPGHVFSMRVASHGQPAPGRGSIVSPSGAPGPPGARRARPAARTA